VAAERRRSALAGARRAAGHTQETLAAILNVDRSTVIRWEAGEHAPQPYLRPRLARVLGRTSAQLSELIDDVPIRPGAPNEADSSIVDVDAALSWIDLHSGASPGSSGRKLSQRLKALDKRALQDRNGQRAKVGRRDVAQALSTYYHGTLPPYRVRVDGHVVSTSILCQADWQNLGIPLDPNDRLNLSRSATSISTEIDDVAATHAVRRVAEFIALHVRLTDDPIYRLLDLDVRGGILVGEVGLAPFVEYALTADLLEGELLDAPFPQYQAPDRHRQLGPTGCTPEARRSLGSPVLPLLALVRPFPAVPIPVLAWVVMLCLTLGILERPELSAKLVRRCRESGYLRGFRHMGAGGVGGVRGSSCTESDDCYSERRRDR
jgi:transcriptional regulator with XRE-family HTH domain